VTEAIQLQTVLWQFMSISDDTEIQVLFEQKVPKFALDEFAQLIQVAQWLW
jgi:hypothetical protein